MRPSLHLLVIDENRKDRASLKQLLADSPSTYIVHEASDPMHALRRRHTPDCILLEVLIDGAVATEVLHHLKRRMNGRPVPIIIWTALRLLPLVQAAVQQAGASGWLFKHRTSPQELERAIRTAVAAS